MSFCLPCKASCGVGVDTKQEHPEGAKLDTRYQVRCASRMGGTLWTAEVTWGNKYFFPTNNKQLPTLAGSEHTNYFIDDEFFLQDGTHIGDGAALEKMLILDKAETHMLGKLSPGVNASTTMWSHAGHIWHLNTAMKLSYGHVAIVDRVFKVPIEDVVDGTPESSSDVTVNCVLNPNALLQADQPL